MGPARERQDDAGAASLARAHQRALRRALGGVGGRRGAARNGREAAERLDEPAGRTVVFVDEIHRFNKAQQDAFLPHVEAGTITLIGATTENPSFEVNAAAALALQACAPGGARPTTSSAIWSSARSPTPSAASAQAALDVADEALPS